MRAGRGGHEEKPRLPISRFPLSDESNCPPPDVFASVGTDGSSLTVDIPLAVSVAALTPRKDGPFVDVGKLGCRHVPPELSEDSGSIAGPLQIPLEGVFVHELARLAVSHNSMVVGVLPGEDGGPRGAANGSSSKSIPKARPALNKDPACCFHHAHCLHCTLIIRHDHEDVRARLSLNWVNSEELQAEGYQQQIDAGALSQESCSFCRDSPY